MRALGLAVFVGLATVVLAPKGFCQTATYRVRGTLIQLEPREDLVFIRPRSPEFRTSAMEDSIIFEANQMGQPAEPYLKLLQGKPPRAVPPLNGYLVPRVKGFQLQSRAALTASVPRVQEAASVYMYHGLLVIPQATMRVRFKQQATPEMLQGFAAALGVRQIPRGSFPASILSFAAADEKLDIFVAVRAAAERPEVQWAQPDMVCESRAFGQLRAPNDSFFTNQWYLQSGPEGIDLPAAWAIWTGKSDTIIAVIDDGIDLTHPDFKGKLVPGFDFVHSNSYPSAVPGDAHGTACAGIIGATTDNSLGVAGVAWNCRILPLKVSEGDFFVLGAMANAIGYAQSNGVRIISLSRGGGTPDEGISAAIDAYTSGGGIFVAAAGNARPQGTVAFPADHPGCISVGAVTRANTLWDYSCFGPGYLVSIVAPSGDIDGNGDIWTTDLQGTAGLNPGGGSRDESSGDYTAHFGGTSAAAPIVAGVCGLLWSAFPTLSATQIRNVLQQTATRIDPANGDWVRGRSPYYGWGKINAFQAMVAAQTLAGAGLGVQSVTNQGLPGGFNGPGSNSSRQPPPTISAVDQQLKNALDARAESYFVRGKEVDLQPDQRWISVKLPKSERGAFMQALETSGARESLVWAPGEVDGAAMCLVSRAGLAENQTQIGRLAANGAIFGIQPVFTNRDALIIPTGTLSWRLKSAEQIGAALEVLRAKHLVPISTNGDILVLSLDEKSNYRSVFQAAKDLVENGLTRWCQPDFSVKQKGWSTGAESQK